MNFLYGIFECNNTVVELLSLCFNPRQLEMCYILCTFMPVFAVDFLIVIGNGIQVQMIVFWVFTVFGIVTLFGCFGGTCCLYL